MPSISDRRRGEGEEPSESDLANLSRTDWPDSRSPHVTTRACAIQPTTAQIPASQAISEMNRSIGPILGSSTIETQEVIRQQVADVAKVDATLDPLNGSAPERQARFETLRDQFQTSHDPVRQHMGRVMTSFLPGLFVGGDHPITARKSCGKLARRNDADSYWKTWNAAIAKPMVSFVPNR